MSEPFRDEMTAALTRAEKLAEENRDLRDELARLRETAHSVRAQSPDDALAAQTLAVLDRLEEATRVDPAQTKPAPERADMAAILPKPAATPTPVKYSLPEPRRGGVGVGTMIVACLVFLAVGIMLGAMTR